MFIVRDQIRMARLKLRLRHQDLVLQLPILVVQLPLQLLLPPRHPPLVSDHVGPVLRATLVRDGFGLA